MKAQQASSTAKVIAASTIALHHDPQTAGLVAPGASRLCELMLNSNRGDRWLAHSAKNPITRALWRAVEALTLPGIVRHYWHRKRWIETQCRRALQEGANRVIVLGAGFDTLGLRLLAEQPALSVLEIDHPATQAAKRQALNEASPPITTQPHYLALDLSTQAWPDLGLSHSDDAVFIIEGVLMYLQADRVQALLNALRDCGAGRVRLIFSFMSQWPDGGHGFRPRSALIETWLRWRGEPFMWALPPAEMAGLLAEHGFALLALASSQDFSPAAAPGQQALRGHQPLRGENLVWCEHRSAATVAA
jgi:methyltransferase (TIGR00027 family)